MRVAELETAAIESDGDDGGYITTIKGARLMRADHCAYGAHSTRKPLVMGVAYAEGACPALLLFAYESKANDLS